MHQQIKTRSRSVRQIVLAVTLAISIVAGRNAFADPVFDPDIVAQAETRMWQAYYTNDKKQIGLQLIILLGNQYGVSMLEARQIGVLLAGAAMKFRAAKGNYEKVVLPDLTKAYRMIKLVSGSSFDPAKAARAELAWWVARRTPGKDSVKQVGKKIADLYAVLYGSHKPAFDKAGLLRAQAAGLRDAGGKDADWVKVGKLLRASYRQLKKGDAK